VHVFQADAARRGHGSQVAIAADLQAVVGSRAEGGTARAEDVDVLNQRVAVEAEQVDIGRAPGHAVPGEDRVQDADARHAAGIRAAVAADEAVARVVAYHDPVEDHGAQVCVVLHVHAVAAALHRQIPDGDGRSAPDVAAHGDSVGAGTDGIDDGQA